MTNLRILILGDASNYHATLADALRRLGHSVTLASDGSLFMDTHRDIDLSRRPGRVGGAILWLRILLNRRRWFRGHDIVLLNGACFLRLKPKRLRNILKYLIRHNRAIFKTALATDTFFVQECRDPMSPLRYNEWRNGSDSTQYARLNSPLMDRWLEPSLVSYHKWFNSCINGSETALYEYQLSELRAMPGGNVEYIGIPIDTDTLPYLPPHDRYPIRILLPSTPGRQLEKGTPFFREAVNRLIDKYPGKIELREACGISFQHFLEHLKQCDIVLDQTWSYTPATTALMAMAMGKTVFTGAEADYLDFIGHQGTPPMINALPDVEYLVGRLEEIIMNPQTLTDRAPLARDFVRQHNDAATVAARAINFWTSKPTPPHQKF